MSTEINIKVSETIDNGGDTAIIFFHEPSIFYYSQYTLDIIKAYASKHKYDVLIFNEPDPEYYSEQKQEKYDKGVCWHKAMACIWSVNNTDYKRFAWLDSDVIILHMDEPIDKFFTRPFNFSTDIFSRWRPTQINSGVFFFEVYQGIVKNITTKIYCGMLCKAIYLKLNILYMKLNYLIRIGNIAQIIVGVYI